ncbi:MAG: aldo/keto reductase [Chitinophagaceae bacterium]|nr:MAG: aldo/keto reductase [Chitinophagaceae bacterium]
MQLRPLGNTPFRIAPLALGANVFGWTVSEADAFPILDAFVEAGGQLVDTADSYSTWVPGNKGGESETIIGNWLAQGGRRSKIVLATKVGSDMGEGKRLDKAYIRRACEASLRRLRTDVIDLYQAHFDDESLPVSEPLEAFAELVQEGKVRAIGASNFSAARLREAIGFSKANNLPVYSVLQPEYNLYAREHFETEYLPIAKQEGLGVINYYALASGFLSGKYRRAEDAGKSPRGGGIVAKYLNDRGRRILAGLDSVAARFKSDPATVALAWTMAQPAITAPIASATGVVQLRELLRAVELRLDEAALQELHEASSY